MAQPNLSKAIKELEDTLGITIFERTSKGVTPTQKGASFLRYAKSILAQLDRMEALCQPDSDSRQQLELALPCGGYLRDGLELFLAGLNYEKSTDIRVFYAETEETVARIVRRQVPFGIIRFPAENRVRVCARLAEQGLRYDVIWNFSFLLLLSEKHPLARQDRILLRDLLPYTEISCGERRETAEPLPDLPEEGEHRRIVLTEAAQELRLLARLPNAYAWASPVAEGVLSGYGLVQRGCADETGRYEDLLVYPKGSRFTDLSSQFLDCLYRAKNQAAFSEQD